MVATRRGTRVGSSERNTDDTEKEPTSVVRRTRRKTVTDQSQSDLKGNSKKDDSEEQTAPAEKANPSKTVARRSKRHLADANQPDSTHEADVSESESCCSVVSSDVVKSVTRGRRRTLGQERPTDAVEQEASEGESCSSPPVNKPRRTTRNQKPASVPPVSVTLKDNDHSEAESCSSVASISKVIDTRLITRSRRKTAFPLEDTDRSEAESCSSAVSAPQGSTVRRSTRNRTTKPTEPIPFQLEESKPIKTITSLRTRGRKAKEKSVIEDRVYESDGCHSGPSASPRRAAEVDSNLETNYTSSDSPYSVRSRNTPCSSRTGSASSSHGVSVSRTRSKVRVTHDSSEVCGKQDSKEGKLQNVQKETPLDVPAAVSDMDDIEEMEENECNRTVINVDFQESSTVEDIKGDDIPPLNEDVISSTTAEKKIVETESANSSVGGMKSSLNTENEENHSTQEQAETEKGVKILEECKKIPESGIENETGFVHEAHGVDDQARVAIMTLESGVIVIEEDEPNMMEGHDVEHQNSSDSVQIKKGVRVLSQSEQKVDALENKEELVADNHAAIEEHKSAVKSVKVSDETDDFEAARVICVPQKGSASLTVTYEELEGQKVEDEQKMEVEKYIDISGSNESELQQKLEDVSPVHIEAEETSCSSNVQVYKTGIQQSKLERLVPSLLDSSEDEESDDEGLSDEEDAGELEDENEEMCSDEDQPGPSRVLDNSELFIIDKRPGLESSEKYYINTTHQENESVDDKALQDELDFVDEEDDDEDEDSKVLFTTRKPACIELSSTIDPGLKVKELGGLYISFDGRKSKAVSNNLKKQKNQDELLKKSVIVADFEKKDAVPPYKESKHAAKLKRKEERAKTTGDGWFNMKAPELTEELRNDLKALKMRSAMDPKRFYKKNDREGFPKYFQVGTVVDNPADFYHSRIPKKQRKRTIVEELLSDAEFRSFNKRKYHEIMTEKAAEAAGKMNKKKHTFKKKK
ncbi:deoxynucleotidyltransferase terminal-interacting protein 2 [Hoplias malabaricus]|uniref:deoxynucleotidyltransferase terminal-interacting protein 2 n=1 Tax=Hoplias malabaricus TaxID=27720 RepID=UPI0034633DEE